MKNNRNFIFVTGASGFIGKNFINKSIKKGFKILALSRKQQKKKIKNLFWVKGELDENFDSYLKQTHTFVHFAATGVNKKKISLKKCLDVNVKKPYKLLLNCIKNGCKNWVIIGSASEYGENSKNNIKLKPTTKPIPITNYERSKSLFTKKTLLLAKKNKIKCRIMRVFNVYGKGENKNRLLPLINNSIKKKTSLIIKSSDQIKDFIEINKATNIIIDALNFKKNNKKFPQIWHIASGKPTTVKNFILSKFHKKKLTKISFRNSSKMVRNFVSHKKFIWKI